MKLALAGGKLSQIFSANFCGILGTIYEHISAFLEGVVADFFIRRGCTMSSILSFFVNFEPLHLFFNLISQRFSITASQFLDWF